MTSQEVIAHLPYDEPFRFVDDIDEISEKGVQGRYRFREDADFYRGHFKNNPVTPGVILLECMAQMALVCQGIYLLSAKGQPLPKAVAFSSAKVDFLKPVLPGEEVAVYGELDYFRLGKIKSHAKLTLDGQLAATAELSGMIAR